MSCEDGYTKVCSHFKGILNVASDHTIQLSGDDTVVDMADFASGTFRQAIQVKVKKTSDEFGPDGYNDQGFNCEGYSDLGYDENGLDRQGFDRDGYRVDGFDRNGLNRKGKDRWGYSLKGQYKGANRRGYKKTDSTKIPD